MNRLRAAIRAASFKNLLFGIIIFSSLAIAPSSFAKEGDGLKALPVQDSGRIKPFDSFARETLELIHGKTTLNGKAASEVVMTWILSPQAWQDQAFFELKNFEIKKALGLPNEKKYFTGAEIFSNDRFSTLRQELQSKRETKEKLTPYFQALQRLENQFFVFSEVATGKMLKLVPQKEGDAWIALPDLNAEYQAIFMDISKHFIGMIGADAEGRNDDRKAALKSLDASVASFTEKARAENPAVYANQTKIDAEVFYNSFHPFRWAYVLYMLSAVVLLFVWITDKPKMMSIVWSVAGLAFLVHIFGFAIRVYLSERPPVSNMYETVVWVAFGAIIFAAILESIYKFKFILLAGLLVSTFAMVIADVAPAILDPTIQPLEPVLRSNYWLLVHVMTITISYAAFFLAFVLSDVSLIYFLKGETQNREKIKAVSLAIYRSIQIGVVFLAPGIILGGIWADYSWGRFWGWDPKETWALIVLLGYIAVLHGRLVGWIKDFGMAATGVGAFALVIMAWYGVNFVLGAGLHSYGFGAGGVEYVGSFVLVHLLFVLYVWLTRNSLQKKT